VGWANGHPPLPNTGGGLPATPAYGIYRIPAHIWKTPGSSIRMSA